MQDIKGLVCFLWLAFLSPIFCLRLNSGFLNSHTEPWEHDQQPVDLGRTKFDAYTDMYTVSASNYLQTLKKLAKEGEEIVAISYNASNNLNLEASDTYLDAPFFLVSETEGSVDIGMWVNRMGNNIHQLMRSVGFAEAKGIPTLKLPKGGRISEFFDLPTKMTIKPRLAKTYCNIWGNGFFLGKKCYKTWRKDDYRRILQTYLKPYMKSDVRQTCQAKANEDLGLVIHLRGGDLTNDRTMQAQSRLPPCVFYDHLIQAHHFTKVTAVAQDGAEDLCAKYLMQKYENSTVQVQLHSRSFAEDSCALMTGRHVTYGLSTYAESMTSLNEEIRAIYVPSLYYNGMYAGGDILYGEEGSTAGWLDCVDSCAPDLKPLTFEMYDIEGFKDKRKDEKKKRYRLNNELAISLRKSCDICH